MRKISLAFVFVFCAIAATSQQTWSKVIMEQIARVESHLSTGLVIDGRFYTLEERMKHYNVQGLSVAVIENNQVIWAKGYGYADRSEKRKVTTTTLFEPGSISKSLNAIGLLLLAQQGKLDLDKDINGYLTSWKFPYDTVSHRVKITTAQLLSHTAGLGVHGFPGYNRDSVLPTIPDILDGRRPSNTEAVLSVSEPGLRSRYSGGGITITQLMVTDLTKKPYEQFMYDNVLKPLGMTNSSYNQPPTASMQKNLATGYKSDGNEVAGKYFVYPEKAAAGLWTTPTDLARYVIEMQLAYNGKSSRVLNQQMVKLHLTPVKQDVAMGTFIQDRKDEKYFDHTASNEGFAGLFIGGFTNGKGAVIVVNSDDASVLFELVESIAQAYNWAGFNKPEEITTVAVNDSTLSKYVGEYISQGNLAAIRKENDGLYYWSEGISSKMHFTSERNFRNIEFPTAKSFTLDETGNVTGFTKSIKDRILPAAQRISDLDTIKAKPGQYGLLGRQLLEHKEYARAIEYLQKGRVSEPTDSSIIENLAHAYLFNGDKDKALEFYRQFLETGNGNDLKAALRKDFEYFRKKGFDSTLIEQAEKSILK